MHSNAATLDICIRLTRSPVSFDLSFPLSLGMYVINVISFWHHYWSTPKTSHQHFVNSNKFDALIFSFNSVEQTSQWNLGEKCQMLFTYDILCLCVCVCATFSPATNIMSLLTLVLRVFRGAYNYTSASHSIMCKVFYSVIIFCCLMKLVKDLAYKWMGAEAMHVIVLAYNKLIKFCPLWSK